MFVKASALCFALAACAGPAAAQDDAQKAWAEQCADWDEWDKPGPPFKVYGNTYYVGTCGISAILIAGNVGTILIDGGTETGADLIAANIEKLGFELKLVLGLLSSHEHHDHVGGLARLQKLTGASYFSSPRADPVMASGVAADDDPQKGMHDPFAPVRVFAILDDGETLKAGQSRITAIYTPGHTPGALSWQWESCEGEVCKTIVYADSLTPVSRDDYRFSDHPEYVAAFRASIARVGALDCDLLLTPHPSASGMRDRLLAGDLTAGPTCREYAVALEKRLDERLAQEAGGD